MRDDAERADVLASLRRARAHLRQTTDGLSTEEATRRTTVSDLTLAGLIKHVAFVERSWAAFAVGGIDASRTVARGMADGDDFRLASEETLASLLDGYATAAAHTDRLVATLDSLEASHPFPSRRGGPEVAWSARRAFLHIATETAQHAGHADLIRESLDGTTFSG
ncbi:DinB family protein [Gordonia sp. (in: high G+C Gram-positive bacteria)]|uniref:DinB family protein n=1 Tax=Gordonia sp. (in: high G+C Gram-positive bacteria) TaxID=84139 RepID=UPI0039E6E04C